MPEVTASTASDGITRAAPAALERISATLARAFHEDPVLGWVVPDPERRRACLPPFFAVQAEAYLALDETHLAGEGEAVALWAPPGTAAVDGDGADAYVERLAAILGPDAERGGQVEEAIAEHHPEEPCWYLQWLAVLPEHRGAGLGGRLLRTVLDRCDATATPAYLEATSEHNRSLYARHGFEVTAEARLPDGGPTLWPMWREPASASG